MAKTTKPKKAAKKAEVKSLTGARLDNDLRPQGKVTWELYPSGVLINGTRWGWYSVGVVQIFTEQVTMEHSRSWLTVYGEDKRTLGRIQAPLEQLKAFRDALEDKAVAYEEAEKAAGEME